MMVVVTVVAVMMMILHWQPGWEGLISMLHVYVHHNATADNLHK